MWKLLQVVYAGCVQIKIRYRKIFPSYRSILLAAARKEEEKRLAVERARYWENVRREACYAAASACCGSCPAFNGHKSVREPRAAP